MNLVSLNYAVLMILTILLFFNIPSRFQWALMLCISYYFYISNEPQNIIFILFITLVAYISAIAINKARSHPVKKVVLFVSVVTIVLLLISIKYIKLLIGTTPDIHPFKWIVPLGISFVTLQTLSYIIDVYYQKIEPEKHIGFLALYISFFPTVSSGPIERGTHLLQQLRRKYDFDYTRVMHGIKIIGFGMFQKVVLADRFGMYVNQVYGSVYQYTGWPLIVATFLFAIQLYCDFSGYTNMARGIAKILGYDLLENFNFPYLSGNIQEFWHRWHISLSTWFRDYLYIPLGGKRVSQFRIYVNLSIVFLLSGLWHGANWTFAAWGAIHGLYQIVARAIKQLKPNSDSLKKKGLIFKIVSIVLTFILVDFAWIFFRANSISEAFYIVTHLFKGIGSIAPLFVLSIVDMLLIALLIALFFIIEYFSYKHSSFIQWLNELSVYKRWAIYYGLILFVVFFGIFSESNFLYSQF